MTTGTHNNEERADENLPFSRQTPYSVPENYFSEFSGSLHDLIKNLDVDDTNLTKGIDSPFEVPSGYFAQLSEQIADKIQNNAINNGKRIPMPEMEVPAGYFLNLPTQLTSKTSEKPRRIPLFGSLSVSNLLQPIKLAAAAVLVLGISLGAYQMGETQRATPSDNVLGSFSKNDINDYVKLNYPDLATEAQSVNIDLSAMKFDNKDIIQYLNEDGWDGAE